MPKLSGGQISAIGQGSCNASLRSNQTIRVGSIGYSVCFTGLLMSGLLPSPGVSAETMANKASSSHIIALQHRDEDLVASNAPLTPTNDPEALFSALAYATTYATNLLLAPQASQLSEVPITPTVGFSLPMASAQVVAQEPTAEATYAPVQPRVGARYNTEGAGFREFFGFEGFVPIFQTPGKDLTYAEGRLLLQPNNTTLGGNVLLGYRYLDDRDNRVYGGYVSYDNRDTGRSFFHQIGVGLEALSDEFDARLNAYFPIGNTRNQVASSTSFTGSPTFSGYNLLLGTSTTFRQYETAATVVDAEFGREFLKLENGASFRGYLGTYYINAQGSPDVVGIRGRLEALPTDFLRLSLAVQGDGLFDTRVIFGLGLTFPGSAPGGKGQVLTVADRLAEGVVRQYAVTVADPSRSGQTVSTSTTEVAQNSGNGNQPYRFIHVVANSTGGNGTFERPFGSLSEALTSAASSGTDVIYVRGTRTETFPSQPTFPSGVSVLFNNLQQFTPNPVTNFNNQRIALPLFDPSANYVVSVVGPLNISGNNVLISGLTVNDTVTVTGNNATLDRLTINTPAGSGPSVQATNVNDLTVRDSKISLTSNQSGTPAVQLTNVTGTVNLTGNTITATGPLASGITTSNSSGTVNLNVAGNTIQNTTNNGINILLNGTAQGTATITGNTISSNPTNGISVAVADTARSTLSITNNTIAQNQLSGILVDVTGQGQATATITGNTISNNALANDVNTGGVTLQSSAGPAQLQAVVENNTISSNTRPGVFIRSANLISPATPSTISTRVRLNTITGTATPGAEIQSFTGSRVCLNLLNNSSATGYSLTNASGTLQVENSGNTGTVTTSGTITTQTTSCVP